MAEDVLSRVGAYLSAHPETSRPLRWALWRHGTLLGHEGDFDAVVDVASLRKTWHAMVVGAALLQGRIPSLDQEIREWVPEIDGQGAKGRATWRHVITQTSGFDYPYGEYPAYAPGEMWTYSDLNLVHLCNALARVYGKRDFHDNFEDVARTAYFDAIGMHGWSTTTKFDELSNMIDGVRF